MKSAPLGLAGVAKKAPYACGNFHACAFTRFQKPQQLGRARIACSCPRATASRASAVASCGGRRMFVEFVTAKRLVCKNGHSTTGRATVPRVLYGIGPHMSLRLQTILSKSLPVPDRVALTIIRAHFSHGSAAGRRFVREEVRTW